MARFTYYVPSTSLVIGDIDIEKPASWSRNGSRRRRQTSPKLTAHPCSMV
jgi:hypothetical protein